MVRAAALILLVIMRFVFADDGCADTWEYYSHKYPLDIVVDSGYAWFCYSNGVIRWSRDGSSYHNYELGLGYNIKTDNNGVVWVAASTGVWYYTDNDWHEVDVPDPEYSNHYDAVFMDTNGTLWLGTLYSISCFDGESWSDYDMPGVVRDIDEDSRGTIWAVTSKGASRFSHGEWTHYTEDDGLAGSSLDALYIDENDVVWLATRGGVTYYDGEQFRTISSSDTRGIHTGSDGTLWCAVKYGASRGVFSYDGHDWTRYERFAGKQVLDVYVDDDGAVWCGTRDNLYKKDGDDWIEFFPPDSIPDITISGITTDRSDNLWVATTYPTGYSPIIASGVFKYDGDSWQQFTEDDGLVSIDVLSIGADSDGNIWCGFSNGISMYNGSRWRSWTYPEIDVDYVWDMRFNANGNGCFRHNNGLVFYDKFHDTMERFDGPPDTVHAIALDNNDTVWCGSDSGIYKQNGENWQYFPDPDPDLQSVSAMAAAPDGTLWIGTSRHGVRHFDGTVWEIYTTDHGITDNAIHNIEIDRNGVVWILTIEGISRYDGNSWQHLRRDNTPPGSYYGTLAVESDGALWYAFWTSLYRYDGFTEPVGIARDSRPSQFSTLNRPNPFNPSTTIEYTLPVAGNVTLTVYSITGQKVATLVDGFMQAGKHSAVFNGAGLASGIYFYRLEADGAVKTGKMVLVR